MTRRMRIQMKWGDDTNFNLGDGTISDECQANFDATIQQAYEYGINHFETARGYGCSEKQFCQSLRYGTIRSAAWCRRTRSCPFCTAHLRLASRSKLCETVDRADIIVQTKVPPKATPEEFREALQRSFDTLQPPGGYIDLFGFHGVNNEERLEWTKLCMPVAKEFQAAGKIKHIGFSTHAMTTTILNAIETDMFDCKAASPALLVPMLVRAICAFPSEPLLLPVTCRRESALPVHRLVHFDR
jgi:predicted aldo/keto reductase-like oxidoreductase